MVQERKGETIRGETVLFSQDTAYIECRFENCRYAFDGTGFNALNCQFEHGYWDFNGPAATTIDALGAFWESPGSEPLLEIIFERITGSAETARKIVAMKG
jgi:hypothetical protein